MVRMQSTGVVLYYWLLISGFFIFVTTVHPPLSTPVYICPLPDAGPLTPLAFPG